ncbi:oligosaccharide flippase family protein [Brevibacillus sp. SYSU BS000544]
MALLKNRLAKGHFVRNVLTLMTGTTIAQAIPIGISPLLTRIYTPDDFGVFALYSSITSLLVVISTARYELAIMLPEEEDDAVNLVGLSIIIAGLYSLVLVLLIWVFFDLLSLLIGETISSWLYFVPISVFLTGTYQTITYWLNRKKNYSMLAKNKVNQTATTAISNVGLGYMNIKPGGLIFGTVLGQFVAILSIIIRLWSEDRKKLVKITREKIKYNALRYIDFPKKSSIGIMFNTTASQLPLLLISLFYGSAILGWYSLTVRVLSSPMSIIGTSVSQVFYEKALIAEKEKKLLELVKKTTKILTVIISIPLTILFIFAEDLFVLVFGESWLEAGVIVKIMIPFFIVRFIFSCQSTLLMVKRRMDYEVKFNAVFMVSQVLSLVLGLFLFQEYIYAFSLMACSGFVIYLVNIIMLFRIAGISVETANP